MTRIDHTQEENPPSGFPTKSVAAPQKISDSIQLLPSLKPDSHIISYGPQDMGSRIFGAIAISIFAGVFSGVPLYFGIRGWPILFERPFEQAGFVVAGALLIGLFFLVYFGRLILWNLFGSTFFTVSKQGLEIKKRFLFFSSSSFIRADDIQCLRMHIKRVSSSSGSGRSSWYTLWVVGRKKYILDSKTPSRETVVWLSETLSEWFSVPCEWDR